MHALLSRLEEGPVVPSSREARSYLVALLAHQREETIAVLFLNAANRLLQAEVVGTGTISKVTLYVQPILRRAIELGASALIVAHNHPSGDREPSAADIAATEALKTAAGHLDIVVHDHLIVTRDGCSSLRLAGLM